jgi:two-component system cell cycle sensor histidine kinase PleC
MGDITAEMIERGPGLDPRVAGERRRRSSRVQQIRERLTTSDTGHRGYDLALLRAYASARMELALPAVALILCVAALSFYWMSTNAVLIWTVFAFSSLILCYAGAQRLKSLDDAQIHSVTWRTRIIASEAVHGCVWGMLPLLFAGSSDAAARTFCIALLLMLSAFNTMISATVPIAIYAAIVPLAFSVIFLIGFKSVSDPNTAVLAMVILSQSIFVVIARRVHMILVKRLAFEVDKDELITELEQAKANSDEARRRAEEASFAKSRFLATMSHELRTPLNAILGFSEVLKNELFGSHAVPAYKDYSGDIHSSGQHLLMLINEILDLSRVEAGRYELQEESVSLAGLAEDCRHLLSIRAQKRDIKIKEFIEPNLPRVWVDERAIRQVVLNLLTNAIKFTPQGGHVTIKVGWTNQGGQYLVVKDNGPGIPEEEIAVVMSSFGRGTLAQKNAEEGSGLGLPIVKGLIELHGGQFTLKSRVREGTEAIVVIPPQRVMNVLPMLDPMGDRPEPGRKPSLRRSAA